MIRLLPVREMTTLSVFISSCLFFVSVETAEVRQNLASQKPAMSDVIFTDDVMKESDAISVVHCAVLCMLANGGSSFTFTPDDVTKTTGHCRCHSSQMTSLSNQAATPNTVYFEIDRGNNVGTSSWLNSTCQSDSDCPSEASAQCFLGKCLCHPNHFFSRGQDVCIVNCSQTDMQDDWVMYPDSSSNAWHSSLVDRRTVPACKELCLTEPRCQAVEVETQYPPPTFCTRLYNPRLEDPSLKWTQDTGRILHKRTCA